MAMINRSMDRWINGSMKIFNYRSIDLTIYRSKLKGEKFFDGYD